MGRVTVLLPVHVGTARGSGGLAVTCSDLSPRMSGDAVPAVGLGGSSARWGRAGSRQLYHRAPRGGRRVKQPGRTDGRWAAARGASEHLAHRQESEGHLPECHLPPRAFPFPSVSSNETLF